ncbi:HNH endonuclease family protein [Streptomyces abikoensis]|uniref:HNH endonuclease family protein n=1 Tax=Streptomyces abikoensis TaxID=97398 RepID=UPI003688FEAF
MRSQEISVRGFRRPLLASTVAVGALLLAAVPGATARGAPTPGPGHARPATGHVPADYDETDCEGPASWEGDVYSDPPRTEPPKPPPPKTPPAGGGDTRAAGKSGAKPAAKTRAAARTAARTAAEGAAVPVKWPKNIPDADEAAHLLDNLDVRPYEDKGYARTKFGGQACWALHGVHRCTTRDVALKQQSLVPVVLDGACRVTGGQWHSEYDNRNMADPLHVDVDHIVPLRNAWGSGASNWSPEKRLEFANDITASPELVVVSTWSNRRKGDKGPEKWLPPGAAECPYVQAWIGVKDYYGLSVTKSEKEKLRQVVEGCVAKARPDRPDRQNGQDRPDRQNGQDRQDQPARHDRDDRPDRHDQPARQDREDREERADR